MPSSLCFKMSALNQKRKITQNDLRLLMLEKKRKLTETKKKIDSPLAKYLDDGTLLCIICNSAIKTETIWNIHINSRQHRDNIIQRKQSKEKSSLPPNQHTTIVKKEPIAEPLKPPVKLKSILKNKEESEPTQSKDITCETKPVNQDTTNQMDVDTEPSPLPQTTELPEGFFDDPVMDAKARNVDYKNPIDEEWDRFQREIQEENVLSEQLLDEDEESAAVDKEIERIDGQMRYCSWVQTIEEKKEQAQKKVLEKKGNAQLLSRTSKSEDSDSSCSSDADFDEYIDWRSKKAFR